MPESGHHSRLAHAQARIAAAALTFAVGDVHGSLAKLRRLIGKCEEYAGERPAKFVFLGDYIDRGPQSAGVVDCLVDLKTRLGEHVVTLKGNHEAMLIEVVEGASPEALWLSQGGVQTLESYGVAAARDLPRRHLDWMRSLPLYDDDGLRFFVHAGIDPARPLAAQDDHDLLWMREPFLSDRRDYGRLIVHGHTALSTDAPDLRDNRLNLDTGAVFGGPLTAAVFSDAAVMSVAFLQAE